MAEEAAGLIDTQATRVAADIGGAAGVLLHALMAANPATRGRSARPGRCHRRQRWRRPSGAAFTSRFSAIAGDFFTAVPRADLYLLKHILHDWDDAGCIRILTNCARAMNPGGRVVTIELALGEKGRRRALGALLDLSLMVMTPGRERSIAQYRELLAAAGLRLAKVTPTRSAAVIMEAVFDD